MWFSKCSHPANSLIVTKEATVEQLDSDFEYVTYHFVCNKCHKDVSINHARFIGGIDKFIGRKPT